MLETNEIETFCKEFKLPTIAREYQAIADQAAKEQKSYTQYLR